MTDPAISENTERMANMRSLLQWAGIIAVSLVVGGLLELAGMPAALFLGPMAGGLLAGLNGASVRVPRLPYLGAQGIIGVLVASSLTPQIVSVFLDEWPLFLAVVFSTLIASSLLGYMISRWRVLPGTTGLWGASPGASTAMVIMAEAFGADAQLVAFMQYVRVIFVAALAAVVARLFLAANAAHTVEIVWFPAIEPVHFAQTILLVAIAGWLGMRLRIPAGTILLPMAIGSVLHIAGLVTFQLPEWLLAASYALIGWNIGLGFTPRIIRHAARALPQVVGSIVVLIAFCGGLAFMLSKVLGVDILTAYLATSPGGMDSVAIIAAASGKVDIPFVMALQTVRYFAVLLFGPPLARMIARRVKD